jgi:hypothetical protein
VSNADALKYSNIDCLFRLCLKVGRIRIMAPRAQWQRYPCLSRKRSGRGSLRTPQEEAKQLPREKCMDWRIYITFYRLQMLLFICEACEALDILSSGFRENPLA